MPNYRLKTAEIDAFQMTTDVYGKDTQWPEWLSALRPKMELFKGEHTRDRWMWRIVNRDGRHPVIPGDWLVLVDGEIVIYKPQFFDSIYEPIPV